MPTTTKMSSSSSSSNGGSEEDETRRPLNRFRDSPTLSGSDQSQGRDDKSGSPKDSSASGSEAKPRKRSKKSKAAAASFDDDRMSASKQSKFIQKVFEMASCEDNKDALGFSEDGLALEIRHVPALGPVLSRYFKHSNPSSFIRQLNNYGFKTICKFFPDIAETVTNKEPASSTLGNNRHVFAHPHFKRDDSSLLETITRKTAVCVKKKSKGEIIRELQHKNEDQQNHIQQMEMHHVEMFQRIMALEAENKQLLGHLEALRRSFQEASNRMEHMVQGVPPPVNGITKPAHYHPSRFRGMVGNTPVPPPPPLPDSSGNPYYSTMDFSRIGFPPVVEALPSQDREGLALSDPFHLD